LTNYKAAGIILWSRFDRNDLGHFLFQDSFDPIFKGHLGHGTSAAGTLQANCHNAVLNVNQLNITAVGLCSAASTFSFMIYSPL